MTGAGAVTVDGTPQRLNETVLLSPPVVRVSLTGGPRGMADLVYDGALFTGSNAFAGEIAHTRIADQRGGTSVTSAP
jgi:hypothetical protein